MLEVRPDLAVGTTPLVQKAKALGIPALYFTNMVSARPLFGVAGGWRIAGDCRGANQGSRSLLSHGEFFRQGRVGRDRRLWLDRRTEGSARRERPFA